MERLRHNRDPVLLGHAPRDPFAGLPQRKAGVDFSDVFGGPPRRSSLCEPRRGAGENADGAALGGTRGVAEEGGERSRRWSSSVVEKAVFGGVGSPSHRRHLGNDFFNDIFRGNESARPTPRRKDRDLFSSTPGSRVLSPTRPLPPTSDAFSGGCTLPAPFSYSTRLAKSSDYSSFRFPAAHAARQNGESIPDVFSFPPPNACAAAIPSQLIQAKDDPRSGTHSLSRQSSSSHKASHGNWPLDTTIFTSDGPNETEEHLKKASTVSNAYCSSGHYHFSIYKWASKGVTRIMPSHFKERTKSGSRLSGVSSEVLQQADLPPNDKNMPQRSQAFLNQSKLEDKILFNNLASVESDNMGSSNEVIEVLSADSDMKSVPCDINDIPDDTGTCTKGSIGFSVEAAKPELENLHYPLDDTDRKGNGDISRHTKKEENSVSDCWTVTGGADGTEKFKQENRENTFLDSTYNASHGVNDAPSTMKDKMLPSRAKGKVKEFIKIFSQETAQKDSGTREIQTKRHKVNDEAKEKFEDQASVRVADVDQENSGNYGEASPIPIAMGQNLMKTEQTTSIRSSGVQKVDSPFSGISDSSVTLSDSTLDGLDDSFCNAEEAHFEKFEMEELSQDQDEVAEANSHQVEIQISETMVQEWSKGKEGNIRSLLSTLQYVLWPGSGWKPVPLVDIIEGTSVRRAYQKALLCLHPDKLQQKGAKVHQKYIAEKVFDILQDAWTCFNSQSSLSSLSSL